MEIHVIVRAVRFLNPLPAAFPRIEVTLAIGIIATGLLAVVEMLGMATDGARDATWGG